MYKNMKNNASDEFYTPEIAINCLLPHLKKEWILWECAWGSGSLATHLINNKFDVVGTTDFFNAEKIGDCIVTNPPYKTKTAFLKRCYELDMPFALLMPLTALEGKERGVLYRNHGIQLIIPNKRINFITPTGAGSGAWFQVAWFTWKLNLPNDLMFVDLL